MPRLTIALLGPPRVELDGAPIAVDTRKAVALLAYLALAEPSGASRDSLAALFWPDVDQARAHAALRRTLSALHKALAGDWLRIDREMVALERGPSAWIDVDRFQACLALTRTHGHPAQSVCDRCLPLLAEAGALYRDDFLAGFTLRDSAAFDDWQFFQAESLRRSLAGLLERLVLGHSRRAEFEPAISYARRWLALDPLHEPAHRQLMQLYAWSGQRGAALRQYHDCLRVLEQELGVAPLEETNRMYEAIREHRLAPPVPAAAVAPTVAATAPAPPAALPVAGPSFPIVGRAAEWNTLQAAYRAAGSDGRLVVLEGEAGIGKTRLAEACLQHVRGQGAVAVVARCYEGELNLAYGPFVEAVRSALGHDTSATARVAALAPHWLAEAARLLPELNSLRPDLPATPAHDSPGAQTRFFEAVRQVLLAALQASPAGGVSRLPGLLLIDDAHWIDEASLDLFTYLVRRLRDQPLCLLVTWRAEQVPAGHRLRQVLAEAQRAGLAVRLELGRLSLPAVAELVRAVLPGEESSPDAQLVERLYHETEGLPFFVVEYLASLNHAAENGGEPPWSLPGGARNLLLARLRTIDETGWQLLHTAAVIGRSFDYDTLHAASGRSDEETIGGLEKLIAAGIVNEVTDVAGSEPAYDFSHEKLRALVYEQMSLARRRLLHRRVAEALSAQPRRQAGANLGALAGQIAQHYQLAGRDVEAAEHFKLAGEHARALYANGEALAHFRAALALGHPEAASLHEAIGDLLTLQGSYEAAIGSYHDAALAASPEAAPMLEHKLGNVHHRRGEWDLAVSHFQAALAALGDDLHTALRSRVYADWSLTAHQQGSQAQARELGQKALALAEAAGDQRALAQAHNQLGILASSQNDLSQARRHLERSLTLAEALGDTSARVAALNNLALAFASHGEYERALQFTEKALALCATQGDRHREAALHSNLADLLYATGQADAAMQHLKRSVTIYAEIGAQAGELQPEIWKLAEW